ncbi:MAG TPA: hypothetical protein VMT35_17715 [Ignavibacteriaceae bacterium]|nr:hypothetical protein [Ignavibacteriaceae bacterium]
MEEKKLLPAGRRNNIPPAILDSLIEAGFTYTPLDSIISYIKKLVQQVPILLFRKVKK